MPCVRPSRISEAHARHAKVASDWRTLRRGRAPRAYVLRHGVAHALAAGLLARARALLTNFAWLQARLGELPDEAAAVADDASATARHLSPRARAFAAWEAFLRESVHLLQNGDAEWPANRVLLQLAVEHADDSPVTRAAEAWLAAGKCDWIWLRRVRVQRPQVRRHTGRIAVMGAHAGPVRGVLLLKEDRILSWADGPDLWIWNSRGRLLATLTGHTDVVNGALELPSGEVLSWSDDGSVRRWNGLGEPIATHASPGPAGPIRCVTLLGDGQWLSWGLAEPPCLWEEDGARVTLLKKHGGSVSGALVLEDGRFVTWSVDGTLRVWDVDGEPDACILAHAEPVRGVCLLPDDTLLSWGLGAELCIWNTEGDRLAVLEGHRGPVLGAAVFPDGRIVSWSSDCTLRVWSHEGEPIAELVGHTAEVTGVQITPVFGLVSTSRDGDVRLWKRIPTKPPEVGITRDEIRQVQAEALRALIPPERRKRLKDYL